MKALITGGAVALAAGLLMGAVAKPDLGGDDRPAGPQILAGWAGARSTGPFDDGASFASYKGQLPDYVLGADWKKLLAPPSLGPEPLPEPAPERIASNDEPNPLPLTHAVYDEAPRAAPHYPSMDGGQGDDADLLPPAHPEDSDDGDDAG